MKPAIAGILAGIILANLIIPLQVSNNTYASTRSYVSNKQSRQHDEVQKPTPEMSEPVHAIPTIPHTQDSVVTGRASFYTNEYCIRYNPACRTASGEVFDDTKFTTACSSRYPLGSILRVGHKDVVVEVKCNDRGSFEGSYGRLLDLSKASFEALAPTSQGVITVHVELVK